MICNELVKTIHNNRKGLSQATTRGIDMEIEERIFEKKSKGIAEVNSQTITEYNISP